MWMLSQLVEGVVVEVVIVPRRKMKMALQVNALLNHFNL
jgi:hypothetical protein